MVAIVVLLLLAADGWIGLWIGSRKGRPVLGLVVGMMLGMIGWIVLAFVPRTAEKEVRDAQHRLQVDAFAAARQHVIEDAAIHRYTQPRTPAVPTAADAQARINQALKDRP